MIQLRSICQTTGLVIAGVCAALVAPANAAQIDLRLDIDYTSATPNAGGVWTLFAETDEQGLSSLIVSLNGINPTVESHLPVGRVNGSSTNNAGFSTFDTRSITGSRQITVGQVVQPQGSQQGVFYGVGALANGAPNYPGRPAGTASIGPNITSLTSVQNVPWGNDDSFSATGVTVVSGTFAAGATPAFSDSGLLAGSLLTSIGTISTPGDRTLDVDITTLVTTNLEFGVATGDYNADGRVDAADYTVWRDTLNESVTALTGADGNGDGLINPQDLNVWATNYGASNAAVATTLPEPVSAFLAAIGLVLSGGRGINCRMSRVTAGKTEQSGTIA